jgi:heme exporter protein B
MTLRSKNNEMIIPILLFPFSIPILLSIIKVTQSISEGATFAAYSNWIFLIIASNILFLVIGIWSFNDIIKE